MVSFQQIEEGLMTGDAGFFSFERNFDPTDHASAYSLSDKTFPHPDNRPDPNTHTTN